MTKRTTIFALAGILIAGMARADVKGWLNWRGPNGDGISRETGLPDTWALGGKNDLWSYKLRGGGTPVIANGRVFALGYEGVGPDLQEVLLCADANTGKKLWEARYSDFISDITYDRYSIGSPCVDYETGNVYVLTSPGMFACYTADGKKVFEHSLMETIGRLTFTNGRTGGPTIENDLVIVRGITSNWGGEGAAMDRLYAFDKKTGKLVWSCGSGAPPKDPSFARPVFGWREGKRVFYTGAGDGSLICGNARTGQLIWRYPVSAGGMNSTVVLYKNLVIGIHADENLDSSTIGCMVAVKTDATPKVVEGVPTLEKSAEVWRNPLAAVSSSPILVGNKIYETEKTGHLVCVDADNGNIVWKHKLAPDQLHASPTYADGKFYIPMQNGSFYIVKAGDSDAQELCKVQLEERCIGAPAIWNGKVYVFSTQRLYCFGKKGNNNPPAEKWSVDYPKPGATAGLQVIPSEVLLRPGEKATFTVRGIDANGFPTETYTASQIKWASFIPPTARVRSEMSAKFNDAGELVVDSANKPSAGAFQADVNGIKGTCRGRVVPSLPVKVDFENFTPTDDAPDGGKFAYPPLSWIGARFKFDVREVEGNKLFAKTLDNIFFQRATVFFGHPDEKNYTVEADVMTDGNRRVMSTVGLINQRYLIKLEGNAQEIVISSNDERVHFNQPFKWQSKTWYHLKTRVDTSADGSGVVRGKAWKKGDPEPSAWTIEAPLRHVHQNGAPGLFGFAPQSLFKVYIDNISVTPNG